jgi:hypothetical protein
MKAFINNTWIHVIVVGLFGLVTQIITANGVYTLTVGTIVHSLLEWYNSTGTTTA